MSSFTKKLKELKFRYFASEFRIFFPAIIFIIVCIAVAISFSFFDKTEVDLRTLVPKDSIIYLESNDLGMTLNYLTESESFKENSKSKIDFSPVNGIQIAVAISGFETSEDQVTDEQSILNFKPKFTVVAETHAWSWQVNSLVETYLNNFITKNYGKDVKLEKKEVNDTDRFTWTANDGRKTFAVISGSKVFFGNDEESINKCLSAKRGETDSLLKNENLSVEYDKSKGKLAFGFISNEGIKQMADLAGVTVAVGQSEDANARGFISRILPSILKNTTREITWTAEKSEKEEEKKVEDLVFIKTEKEVSKVFSETLIPDNKSSEGLYEFLPFGLTSVTRYNLKNPLVSFRSLLLVTAKNTDPVNAKIIAAFSNSLLGQYGIADAENFLNSVESELLTAKINDESVAIVRAKDPEKVKATFFEDIKPQVVKNGEIWKSEENNLSVVFKKDILIMGDSESVLKCLQSWSKRNISTVDNDFIRSSSVGKLRNSKAAATTYVRDAETAGKIVKVLGTSNDKNVTSNSLTETRFSKQGIERKYISDYGFLGTIIEQFASE